MLDRLLVEDIVQPALRSEHENYQLSYSRRKPDATGAYRIVVGESRCGLVVHGEKQRAIYH